MAEEEISTVTATFPLRVWLERVGNTDARELATKIVLTDNEGVDTVLKDRDGLPD